MCWEKVEWTNAHAQVWNWRSWATLSIAHTQAALHFGCHGNWPVNELHDPMKSYIAKFIDEQYATINQSTQGSLSTAYKTCKQVTKTLGSKRPVVDWLIVAYCSSVNFAIINATMSLYSIRNHTSYQNLNPHLHHPLMKDLVEHKGSRLTLVPSFPQYAQVTTNTC